jgi:hypothetical protein
MVFSPSPFPFFFTISSVTPTGSLLVIAHAFHSLVEGVFGLSPLGVLVEC